MTLSPAAPHEADLGEVQYDRGMAPADDGLDDDGELGSGEDVDLTRHAEYGLAPVETHGDSEVSEGPPTQVHARHRVAQATKRRRTRSRITADSEQVDENSRTASRVAASTLVGAHATTDPSL